MKKITAVIRSDKFKDVEKALREVGAPGFTFFNVRGHGRESETYFMAMPESIEINSLGIPPALIVADILPRVIVEVVCKDDDSDKITEAVRLASISGKSGDGIIYVTTVDSVQRILSGEEGAQAL